MKRFLQRGKQVRVGARDSALSRAQVAEVAKEFSHLTFLPTFIKTGGDLDRTTSLRLQEKSNFFTKELDEMLLEGKIDIAIHSAKDLPDPLPQGLLLAYLTKGVDPRDTLVHHTLQSLPKHARVGTSSLRREEGLKKLRPDIACVDIRGTIEERLQREDVDAVIVAQAALIRLELLDLVHEILPFEPAQLQGRLAIVVKEDEEVALFGA